MAFRKLGNLYVASVVRAPDDWFEALQTRGTLRLASKEAANVIAGYSPDEFIFTHNTIIASVDVSPDQDWMITAETQKYINDNKDSWERGVLANDWRTFVGAENYQEHVQIPSLSKGKIVDGAIRDIGDALYVDILVATSRHHKGLCKSILAGEMNAMSMGCVCDFTICSRCGNRAVDETQLCEHVRYSKGNVFIGPDGKQRLTAELCGHRNEPGSVRFIEASWVANPAFRGAVTRNVLDVPSVGIKSHQKQFFAPANLPHNPAARSKVAIKGEYIENDHENRIPGAQTNPDMPVEPREDFSEIEDRLNEHKPGDDAFRPFDIRRGPGSKSLPVKFLEENLIHSKAKDGETDFIRRFKASSLTDEQLWKIRDGVRLFRVGGFNQVAGAGFSGVEILSLAYFLDRHRPPKKGYEPIPLPHFVAVRRVGGLSKFASELEYLKTVSSELGRKFRSKSEAAQVVALAKLFDLGKAV